MMATFLIYKLHISGLGKEEELQLEFQAE